MTSSSISGSGSGASQVDQDLYQFLQKAMARRAQEQGGDGDGKSTLAAAMGDAGMPSANGISGTAARGHHHHHRHGSDGTFQKIESAVADALKSAGSGGSGQDLDQVIQDAIEKVLQGGDGTSATGSASSGTQPAAGQDAAAAGSSSRQAFLQMLQGYGIGPQQFFQDFQAAMQKVNVGQATLAVQPGTGVDVAG